MGHREHSYLAYRTSAMDESKPLGRWPTLTVVAALQAVPRITLPAFIGWKACVDLFGFAAA